MPNEHITIVLPVDSSRSSDKLRHKSSTSAPTFFTALPPAQMEMGATSQQK